MGQRYEDVENHHDEIFKWVFEGDGELDNDEWVTESDLERRLKMRNQARDRFLTWLSSPTEIFHISGKLGSGKSTLMKYLYSSPSTRDQVKKWASKNHVSRYFGRCITDCSSKGSKKVVFANFFFWKPGSKLQRSLDGLFRSLLHDILDAAWPTLAREVLHEYWVKAEQTPWQVPIKLDIPFNAVKEALEKIIEGKQHEARHLCFCFFIDGLDEYDDDLKIQQDRTFLVDLLHSWNKISSGNLMVCVSSREDTVFMDAFPPDRRLRLHDLTSHDMWSYTRDALAKFPNEAVKNRLLQIIPNRAEGIFLWTSLVIKNIREILPEGDSINHELDEILDELPSGLEELVQRILQSLSKRDQRKAYRTVALLQAADDNDHNYPGYPGLTLLAFSFLDKYEKDQDFFLRDSFLTHKQDTGRSFYTYQKQLQRVCGGLIEWHPYRWSEKTWGRLVWTHRSVPEIFSGDKLKGTMERALGNFNSALAFVRLAYAELLFWRAESSEDYFVYEDIHMVLSLLRRVTEGSYWLMESIDSRIKAMRSQTPESCLCIDLRLPHQRGWRNSWVGCLPPSSPVGFNLLSIFLCCVVFEHHVYVRWKIENDPEALKGLEGTIATHLMLRKGPDFWTWDHATGTNVFTDKTRINFIFHMSDSLGLRWTTTANLTIWERYQLAEFLDCYWPDVRRGSGPFGYIAELFLERGAATDFSVIVKGDSWVDEVVFRFKHVDVILSEIDYHVHTDDMRSAAFPRLRALIQKCERDGQFTLRDWIESSDLENKDRLLQLLDASKESIKSCRPEEVAETGQLRSEAQGDGPNASEKGGLERLEDTTKTEPRPVPETRPAEKAEFWPRVAIGMLFYTLCRCWPQ